MNATVIVPSTYEAIHYEAVCRLIRQLTAREVVFTPEDYRWLVTASCSRLFLLLVEGNVVGMLTIGMYLSPTGSKAWIEDVVVDESLRGCGMGRMLVEHAIDFCKKEGVDTVYLTSNPKRIAANGLYQSVGFGRKETNMYKMDLKK
jgi:GNAT superfamily N-acetyltransferase